MAAPLALFNIQYTTSISGPEIVKSNVKGNTSLLRCNSIRARRFHAIHFRKRPLSSVRVVLGKYTRVNTVRASRTPGLSSGRHNGSGNPQCSGCVASLCWEMFFGNHVCQLLTHRQSRSILRFISPETSRGNLIKRTVDLRP